MNSGAVMLAGEAMGRLMHETKNHEQKPEFEQVAGILSGEVVTEQSITADFSPAVDKHVEHEPEKPDREGRKPAAV